MTKLYTCEMGDHGPCPIEATPADIIAALQANPEARREVFEAMPEWQRALDRENALLDQGNADRARAEQAEARVRELEEVQRAYERVVDGFRDWAQSIPAPAAKLAELMATVGRIPEESR